MKCPSCDRATVNVTDYVHWCPLCGTALECRVLGQEKVYKPILLNSYQRFKAMARAIECVLSSWFPISEIEEKKATPKEPIKNPPDVLDPSD